MHEPRSTVAIHYLSTPWNAMAERIFISTEEFAKLNGPITQSLLG